MVAAGLLDQLENSQSLRRLLPTDVSTTTPSYGVKAPEWRRKYTHAATEPIAAPAM
jgi:hypothetical protein